MTCVNTVLFSAEPGSEPGCGLPSFRENASGPGGCRGAATPSVHCFGFTEARSPPPRPGSSARGVVSVCLLITSLVIN